MDILERPIFDRERPARVRPVVMRVAVRDGLPEVIAAAVGEAMDMPMPSEGPPVVGACSTNQGWYDAMKQRIVDCLPPGALPGSPASCGTQTPDGKPCREPVIDTTVGAEDTLGAVAANDPFSCIVTLEASFWPMLVAIADEIATVLRVTTLKYGPQNKLISESVGGSAFSNQNAAGGYRMPADRWLTAGQKITIAGVALDTITAGTLIFDVAGFTPA